ncbi:hypothetical protein [Actinoplanes aureus]|uniref:Uncharacterized protein n=1 Tax=Actinoplanes aureus TaxID=2792083 RepID=A0A931CF09_9ACTN|nr:hypothetical protein [Actinoplanes aureus]MBG0565316.1 hypothetical protein [Actinoplanes aureus]
MKQLSDLLREAKAEAPPLRLDVDNVVAAGRTRRRRRNTGWALGAVVTVAATIAVPQVLARPETRRPPVVAATSATPSSSPGFFPFRALSQPYRVGELRVEEPHQMGVDGSMARIERDGEEMGALWILPPGVSNFTWGDGVSLGSTTVNGRRGEYRRAGKETGGPEYLEWQYAEGATALVWLSPRLDHAEGKAVAEAFEPVGDVPATVGFRLGYVPGDYQLMQVNTGAAAPMPMRLSFLTTEAALVRLRDDQAFAADDELRGAALSVSLTRARSSRYPDGEVECAEGECRLWRKDAGVLLQAKGLPAEEPGMKRMLLSVTPAEDVPVDDAVPASARLPRR